MMRPVPTAITTVLSAALVVASLSAVPGSAAQRSDTDGIKETANFVKAGGETSSAVGEAKMRVQNTLTAYNTLVTQPSKDMKGDYKKLLNAVKDMNESLGDARQRVTAMEAMGTTYFAGRAASIKGIQDEQLRAQAQQRLDESQKRYANVLNSLREAGQSLEPVRKDLGDQITYLGSDLSPSGTASLKAQAEKLNQRAGESFGRADQAIMTANSYFNSLKPAES
jgi:hypothetical protein